MRKGICIVTIFVLFTLVFGAGIFDFHKVFAAQSASVQATIKITVCGNNTKEAGEQCDGTDLNGATCDSRGFSSGTLSCTSACEFNTLQCTSASPPPSGGGGGGGGYVAPPVITQVTFTGRAYPKSTITLLKDAQVAATTIAGADANFQVSISGLSGGNYIFSIYSEDRKGIRSALLTFPVSVTSSATTNVSGIFIMPTIAVDKNEVKRGDSIAIFGQSAMQADITISVSSNEEFFAQTIADKDGIYLYNFDTSVLDYATHYVKSKAAIGNLAISGWSNVVGFKVGTKTVLAQLPAKAPAKGDSNGDNRVNLVDFSIAAYWYKRSSPPVSIDLNGDGKIDLVDFSIMAYYWTG